MTATTAHPTTGQLLIPGAIAFAGIYLASGQITPMFADGSMPQPDVDPAHALPWFVENATASAVQASLGVLSVAGLALFVAGLAGVTQPATPASGRSRIRIIAVVLGIAAVTAMVVSSVLAWIGAATAADLTPAMFGALRTSGFYAGGTVHVALLGLFAATTSMLPAMSKPVRVFAIIVAVIAVASLASLAWYYASLLILLGRLLGMAWVIVAAISMVRRRVGVA